ncbi:MAG: oligosaccharide flippase family protein [Bacteroidota bacterium]
MKRPLQNILAMMLGDAGSRLIGFLVTVYLARILEPSGFGVINIGLSVLGFLALAGSPGIQVLEARNVAAAREVDRERIATVLAMRLALAVILLIAVWIGVRFLVTDQNTRTIVVLYAVSLIPLALMLDWYFLGKEDLLGVGVAKIATYAVYGTGVWVLIHSSEDVYLTPVAFAVGNITGMAFLFLRYRRQHGFVRLQWDPKAWGNILSENIPVGAATFLGQSVVNLPPILIAVFLSASEVGIFSAAMKIIFLLLILDRVFNALFLPVISRYYSHQPDQWPRLFAIALKTVVLLVLPIGVLGVVMSGSVINLVFGPGYGNATGVLAILLGYFVCTLVSSIFVNTLIVAGRDKKYTQIMFISTLILGILVVTGTVVFGLTGAAVGVVVAEAATMCLLGLEAQRIAGVSILPVIVRLLIAGAAMACVAFLLAGEHLAVMLVGTLSTFVITVAATKGVDKEEIRFLQERFV